MKYAAKPQKLNPHKPDHVDDWAIWECIHTSNETAKILEQNGWFISDVDNFVEWFALKKICPEFIYPRQARQALILNGISETMITNALNNLPSPTKELAKAEWFYSNEFKRDRPLVKAVGTMLGWTDFKIDQLFVFAWSLK